ncbi:MAG TPA: nitroreductase/quinone reductase family protein [Jiangellaceae bacterium]|nr:nitroreductase/quinone reductase family protein [Jiangellaceae bacterium]
MPSPDDHNSYVIASFRRDGGKVGGPYAGLDLLLLHHTGAKSGTERVSPLLYWRATAVSVAVLASSFGADRHPAWYINLLAHPLTTVEIGRETWQVRARVATTDERAQLLDRMKKTTPGVAHALHRTSRTIPVVILERRAVASGRHLGEQEC